MAFGSLPQHILPLTSQDVKNRNSSKARPFFQTPWHQRITRVFKSRQTKRIFAVLAVLFIFWRLQTHISTSSLPSPILSKTADSDLKIAIKQQVVDVSLKDPLEDSLERRWQLASQSDLKGAIEELVQKSPVVVFSKTYCPFSKAAKKLLGSFNLSPAPFIVEADLRSDTAAVKSTLGALTNHYTFPNVFVGGKHIGGSDTLTALAKSGELLPLLRSAGLEILSEDE